jgi:uncharacterized protein
LSALCIPEIVSALNRRRREGSLTAAQYRQAKQRVLEDMRDADIIQRTPGVIATSIEGVESAPLPGMNALHIACVIPPIALPQGDAGGTEGHDIAAQPALRGGG